MKERFTKKDLKVGDIITLRNGKKGKWNGEEFQVRNFCWLKEYNIENDLTNNGNCGSELDIVKVERKTKTEVVYKRKKEILDEAEKRYLREVIRPFRNRVKYIRKTFHYNNIEFITIVLDDEHFPMPNFKKDTMYKGMKLGKEYSLKELGL
jgi:hypothetical protein